MDSDANSSFEQSTQDSLQARTQKSSAASTWMHSRAARDKEDPQLKYCIHCTTPHSYGTTVTTNMRNHLTKMHGITVSRTPGTIQNTVLQQLQQLYVRAESSGQTNEIDS